MLSCAPTLAAIPRFCFRAMLARACGHDHLNKFTLEDLTTFDRDMAHLTGIAYGGVNP